MSPVNSLIVALFMGVAFVPITVVQEILFLPDPDSPEGCGSHDPDQEEEKKPGQEIKPTRRLAVPRRPLLHRTLGVVKWFLLAWGCFIVFVLWSFNEL